ETERRRPQAPVCQPVPERGTTEQKKINHLRPPTPAAAEAGVDEHWKRQNTENGSHPPIAPRDIPSASPGQNLRRRAYELDEEIQKRGADNDPQSSPDNPRRGRNFGAGCGGRFHRQQTIAQKSYWGRGSKAGF